jgi:hypothetical protein
MHDLETHKEFEGIKVYASAIAKSAGHCATVWGHHDGFGASYSGVISGVLWARSQGIPFRHTRLQTLAHWYPETDGPYEQLDALLGLTADDTAVECEGRHHFPMDTRQVSAEDRRFLREMYWSTPKTDFEPVDFGPEHRGGLERTGNCRPDDCDVVVHVRRGDDSGDLKHLDRPQYISDGEWLTALDSVLAAVRAVPAAPQEYDRTKTVVKWHPRQPAREGGDSVAAMRAAGVRVHLYSEGAPEDFGAFARWAKANGIALRLSLNGDLRHAFHAMALADVLAFGPSSFPKLAALYNAGWQFEFDKAHTLAVTSGGAEIPIPDVALQHCKPQKSVALHGCSIAALAPGGRSVAVDPPWPHASLVDSHKATEGGSFSGGVEPTAPDSHKATPGDTRAEAKRAQIDKFREEVMPRLTGEGKVKLGEDKLEKLAAELKVLVLASAKLLPTSGGPVAEKPEVHEAEQHEEKPVALPAPLQSGFAPLHSDLPSASEALGSKTFGRDESSETVDWIIG